MCDEVGLIERAFPAGGRLRRHLTRATAKCEGGFAAPKPSTILPFAPIYHLTNMSGKHVLQGAQNVSISGGTFIAADSVREALLCLIES